MSGPNINMVTGLDGVTAFKDWVFADRNREVLSFDTETSGLTWWNGEIRVAQFGDDKTAWVVPFGEWKGVIREVFDKYDGPIAGHNMKFDLHWLRESGIKYKEHLIHDTMILSSLEYPLRKVGLKELAKKYDSRYAAAQSALDNFMSEHGYGWHDVPINADVYWIYAGMDTILTSMLFKDVHPKIKRDPELYDLYQVEMQCMMEVMDMEKRGLKVDIEYLHGLQNKYDEYIKSVEDWATKEYKIDIRKTNQLRDALLKDGWQPTKYTKTGKISLAAEVFEDFDHPLSNAYTSMKSSEKINSTFVGNLLKFSDENGIIKSSIKQIEARTGRMSITEPALQTMPRTAMIRNAFIPREGNKLVAIDYDQMELRIAAHYAKDQKLIDACNQADVHTTNAKLIYGLDEIEPDQRQLAKNGIYCVIYHGSVDTLAATVDVSHSEASRFKHGVFQAYPGIKRFMDESSKTNNWNSEFKAYWIRTRDGRYEWATSGKSKYMLTNYMIQGTGADILKKKIVYMGTEPLLKSSMILPMHDEVLFEVPEDKALECLNLGLQYMEDDSYNPTLTVSGDIIDRWGDKYE